MAKRKSDQAVKLDIFAILLLVLKNSNVLVKHFWLIIDFFKNAEWIEVLKMLKSAILAAFGQDQVDYAWEWLLAQAQKTVTPWDDMIVERLHDAWDKL